MHTYVLCRGYFSGQFVQHIGFTYSNVLTQCQFLSLHNLNPQEFPCQKLSYSQTLRILLYYFVCYIQVVKFSGLSCITPVLNRAAVYASIQCTYLDLLLLSFDSSIYSFIFIHSFSFSFFPLVRTLRSTLGALETFSLNVQPSKHDFLAKSVK